MMRRKIISFIAAAGIIFGIIPSIGAAAADMSKGTGFDIDVPSAILMEVSSGEILYEKDAYAHRSPASVTKLMTMLLAAEAVDSGVVKLDDKVYASSKAAGMGGSQIWLEEGECMSFDEMLKCLTVVSANDCCVAIAEHLAGSEDAFVAKMNDKARELGLSDSHFLCSSGLSDSDEHYSCAYDLAVIGRELLKHEFIKEYTTIWTDSIRGGEFGLSNTNKLLRRYKGATGLKTGFTSKALHCLAASAERDGEEYIAVVLGAESSALRFDAAAKLLDYAYANYTVINAENLCPLGAIEVKLGKKDSVGLCLGESGSFPAEKSGEKLEARLNIPEYIYSPVSEGQQLGIIEICRGEEILKQVPVLASESVDKLGFINIFVSLLSACTHRSGLK